MSFIKIDDKIISLDNISYIDQESYGNYRVYLKIGTPLTFAVKLNENQEELLKQLQELGKTDS